MSAGRFIWADKKALEVLLWKDGEDRSKTICIASWGNSKPKKQVIELDGVKLKVPPEPKNKHFSKHYNSGAYRAGYAAGYERAKRKYGGSVTIDAELKKMEEG